MYLNSRVDVAVQTDRLQRRKLKPGTNSLYQKGNDNGIRRCVPPGIPHMKEDTNRYSNCPKAISSPMTTISIVAVSDTHSRHASLPEVWPQADIFIHTGDLTQHGTKEELSSVIEWLAGLPYAHKVCVAGNHDIGLDKDCSYRSAHASSVGTYATPEDTNQLIASMRQRNITYLSPENPSANICVKGSCVNIYGLPYSPYRFGPCAFQRPRIEDTWAVLDGECKYDILLSHAPPKGHLDLNKRGDNVGCEHFMAAIERVRPAAAIFGHIHEAKGIEVLTWDDGSITMLYNAAVMNRDKTLSTITVFDLAFPMAEEPKNLGRPSLCN